MEAIHPKASKPLEINAIDLRIKNTFEPDHPGTLITRDYVSPTKHIEVITGTDKVVIIDIHDPLMVGAAGFDLHLMQVFFDLGVSYIFKATSANSISLLIWEKDLKPQLMAALEAKYENVTVEDAALVCLIGSNIDEPGPAGPRRQGPGRCQHQHPQRRLRAAQSEHPVHCGARGV